MTKVVVVGGVAGGMSAASKAKREDPSLDITVYEKSGYISYGACGMPYVISGQIPKLEKLLARTPEKMAERGVTARVNCEVTEVDHARRRVTVRDLASGKTFGDAYDVLVLATGARPVRPKLPGVDLGGVYTLRQMEDAATLQEAVARGAKRAVIVGGSYVGLEMAEAFSEAGLEVAVVERLDRLLASFGPVPSKLALEELEARGVEVSLNTEVLAFEGEEHVRHVLTSRGALEADLVLVSVGVRPNNELAKALGLTLGPAGAVVTDAQLRTGLEDVYAVGDVTAVHHLVTGSLAWVPLGDTANRQGRVAGEVIAGKEARFRGVVGTAITKVFDRTFATTGLTPEAASAAGFKAKSTTTESRDRAGYYPGRHPIHVTLVWEEGTERLLGAQIAGYGDAPKRIDVVAALLFGRASLRDLADLDLAYAPPFGGVWDPLLVAANVALE